eukprot:gene12629-14826_t
METNEDLLNMFTDLMSTKVNSGDKEFIYKSYCIDNRWVTLKNELIYNLVGMTTWGAAYLLSDFITANKDIFTNKHILELGSGTGLVGPVLDTVSPSRVVLTDYSPIVLNNLLDNMVLTTTDSIQLEVDEEDRDNSNIFSVRTFDWEAPLVDSDWCRSDIIVGADIVYEPSLCRYLVAVLHKLCTWNPKTTAYIASTIRNKDTFATFQQELQSHRFQVLDVTATATFTTPSPFEYDRSQIVLYQITLDA